MNWNRWLQQEIGEGEGGGGGVETPPSDAQQSARLQNEIAEQRRQIEQLGRVVAASAMRPPQQAPPPGQPGPSKEELTTMFWKDPLTSADAISRRAAYETVSGALNNAIPHETLQAVARDKARSYDPDNFDKLEVEIEAKMAQLPPQFRSNINAWINAMNMSKGENFNRIKDGSKNVAPAIHSSGPAGASTPPPPRRTQAVDLNDDEKRFAKNYGLTDEEYQEGKTLLANQDTSWEQVLTFDSQQARRQRQREEAAAKKRN